MNIVEGLLGNKFYDGLRGHGPRTQEEAQISLAHNYLFIGLDVVNATDPIYFPFLSLKPKKNVSLQI